MYVYRTNVLDKWKKMLYTYIRAGKMWTFSVCAASPCSFTAGGNPFGEAKNGVAVFASVTVITVTLFPPRIPFRYPRKPPQAAIPLFLNLLMLFRHLGL